MDEFSNNSWNTTGGSRLGQTLNELLKTRKMDLEKEMNMGYKEVDFIPSGGENFEKTGNQIYNWSGQREPLMRAHPGGYFNDTEESSFKKLSYGDSKVEMKRTMTQIFKY